MTANQRPGMSHGATMWWERRWFLALIILLSAVPLLYPPIPPLVDLLRPHGPLPGRARSQPLVLLQQYYSFHWAAIGNLGVDLLVMGLGPLIGLEAAVKLIVLTIPVMTVAGFLWVAREVHGRVRRRLSSPCRSLMASRSCSDS